jgi:UDPglucose 6-dehydrogenase
MSTRIGVLGLWHLGCVTSAGLATRFEVVGLDAESGVVTELNRGKAPVFEPGLDALIEEGLASKRLSFSTPDDVKGLDVLWLTYDTPIDENDVADVPFVLERLRQAIPCLKKEGLLVISSQLPVGTCRKLEEEFSRMAIHVACVPENLRLGEAIDIFIHPDRIVAGTRTAAARKKLEPTLAAFSQNIIWISLESAEMSKHAINSFLALSITFMNEIAQLCERTGADAHEVSQALKSESRIGPRAYLSPGAAFAGGTLGRDVVTLTAKALELGERIDVIPAIHQSTERHRLWTWRKLEQFIPVLKGSRIALFGLTYKPQTDTLRRSNAVQLAQRLSQAGAHVVAWDPIVHTLSEELRSVITLVKSPTEAVKGADALVTFTPWPQFQDEDWGALLSTMKCPLILDESGFLKQKVAKLDQVNYFAVGVPKHA